MNLFLRSALLFLLCCFALDSYAAESAKHVNARSTPATKGMTWVKKQFVLPNPPPGFSVKFDYPYFSGKAGEVVGILNNAIEAELMKQAKAAAKDYSDFVSDDLPISKEAKQKKDGSSITATFTVHKTTGNVVSVSFATCSYYFGAAHPVNNYFVFNTQLNPLVPITLSNLATDQKKFLTVVSKQCAQKIKMILKYPNAEIIAEGTAPNADNFQNFVLLDKDLGFYFNDAQASIHAEPIQVPIGVPYTALKGLISPSSPVAKF